VNKNIHDESESIHIAPRTSDDTILRQWESKRKREIERAEQTVGWFAFSLRLAVGRRNRQVDNALALYDLRALT
jgi:hypothetical protein